MEQAHWLSRKRASLAMAKKAATASSRLIHYEMAGRYSVKAAEAAPQLHVEDEPPIEVMDDGRRMPPLSGDRP
jgi:hypothetical protein